MRIDRKYNVIIVGTFDCENFGDLLFPIALEKYLEEQQVLNKLYLFSPKDCSMPFYEERHVNAISEMENFILQNQIDAIIIGGGDLIRLDNNIGKSYSDDNDANSLWAIPIILGKQYGIPVILNCPGVPFEFNNGNKKFVEFILNNADFLSVRDEYSKEYLLQAGVTKEINVSIDTIVGITRVYTPQFVDSIYERLKNEIELPDEEYIILQINNSIFNNQDINILSLFIQRILSETKYKIVFMPIGYEHNDHIALANLKNLCSDEIYMSSRKLNPIEMISIIKNSKFFMGTSLHGAVISYAYGIKFMEIMSGFSTKIFGFCKKINAEKCIININDNLWEKFCLLAQGSYDLLPQKEALYELDKHIENMIIEMDKVHRRGSQKILGELFRINLNCKNDLVKPKLYFDFGNGYNEDNVYYCKEISIDGFFNCRYDVATGCKSIRFDPVENFNCILILDYIVSNKGNIEIAYSNGIELSKGYVFNCNDPMVELKVEEEIDWIELQGHIVYCKNDDEYSWNCVLKEFIKIRGEYKIIQQENTIVQQDIIDLKSEIKELVCIDEEKNKKINQVYEELSSERDNYNSVLQQLEAIQNSTCWRMTKPLRIIIIAMRKLFNPKIWGKTIKKIYMSIPISITTKLKIKGCIFKVFRPFIKNTSAYKAWVNYNQGIDETIAKERRTVIVEGEKSDYISQIMDIPFCQKSPEYKEKSCGHLNLLEEDVKYLAFYLPQFHPFPENDEWWGKGFTEWTNVTKAIPQFVGHNQPRLTGELGYYDLRNKEIIQQQMELAKIYGIYGFCIYYYWFDGTKLMDTPLRLIMENNDLDLPFCLCWANENWSRKWDGKNQDILIAQNYDNDFPLKFIRSVIPYLKDSRYITIDGKPILVIYNANEIPHLKTTIFTWREYCRSCGIGEIHLLAVDFALNSVSREAGFDGFVEFPPHSVYHYGLDTINDELKVIDNNYAGRIFDYGRIVEEKQYLKRDLDKYYKGIFLGWDNTARRPKSATVFHRFTITAFKEWLSDITRYTIQNHDENDRFVFINAWNEWAEGTYLEPDRKFGFAALNTVREVLKENSLTARKIIYVCHDACYNGAQLLSLNLIEQLKKVFHYEVYVILIGGGVLLSKFEEISSDIICLEKEKDHREALMNWLSKKSCKKAMCNTVVCGDILRILHDMGIHCISMIHEMESVIKYYKCEQKLQNIVDFADKIVFASNYVRKSVDKICHIPEEKVVIAPQGMYKVNPYDARDIATRKVIRDKYHFTTDMKIALGVGFGDYRKGIDLFVKSAIKVCEQDDKAAFIWLGEVEPDCKCNIEELLKNSSAAERIIFAGPSDDVYAFYSACDVFVLTSREDPFPTVVMEAMSASLPVVAFKDGGGYVENITEETGMLVNMEDWEDMSQCIIDLFENEEKRIQLGNNAREYVTQKFSFIGYIFTLLGLLKEDYKKVSVVVPNYNYSSYLKQRIDSILQQDYPIYELILLDDKSSDDSLEIMYQYQKQLPLQVKVYANDVNSGNVFNQWEKGYKLAKGEYIWIAEADDLSANKFVSSIMNQMEEDSEIILGYSQSYMMDENGKVTAPNYFCYTDDVDSEKWKQNYVSSSEDEIVERMAVKNTIPNVSGVVFKKQDFSDMFTEAKKYNVAGDWAFYVKLMEKGGKVLFVADSLNYHRRHSNSVTSDLKAQIHYDEICKMQDYVMQKYPEKVDKQSIMKYRTKVKKDLGL